MTETFLYIVERRGGKRKKTIRKKTTIFTVHRDLLTNTFPPIDDLCFNDNAFDVKKRRREREELHIS